MVNGVLRCFGNNDPLLAAYHDEEWGVPVHDDKALFEHLILDSFQAGLSWQIILHKRDNFRRVFEGFDPHLIARYTDDDVQRLLADAGIVRNRRKIEATIANAQAYLALVADVGSFDGYIWGFTNHQTHFGPPAGTWKDVPTVSAESKAMSQSLKQRGFKFVGPTICYAFMQAVGMVDDHLVDCFKFRPRSK
jgi:DNA-3-methyladenine glycosylase I